jgi:hypothetical protein
MRVSAGMTDIPLKYAIPILIACAIAPIWFLSPSAPAPAPDPAQSGNEKFSDIQPMPDPNLTPGDKFPVTVAQVCPYAKSVRDVDAAKKALVYRNYGISSYESSGLYVIDHLIPLALGGSNNIRNLWPQPTDTQPWNNKAKDQLEGRLHKIVCNRIITLDQAQQEIAHDWVATYQKYLGQQP